jgi:hypothetical protein
MSSANTADSPEARVAAGERDALRRVAIATFGVGFVARPFGAVLFGWVGDRIGLNRYQERRGSPEAVVARLEWGLLDETAP